MQTLLDESLRFFSQYRLPTGLYLDKLSTDGSTAHTLASTSAAGFGLISLCISAERGILSVQDALAQATTTIMTRAAHWFACSVQRGSICSISNKSGPKRFITRPLGLASKKVSGA